MTLSRSRCKTSVNAFIKTQNYIGCYVLLHGNCENIDFRNDAIILAKQRIENFT